MCNAVVKAVKIVHYTNKVACGVTSPRGNNQPGHACGHRSSPLAFMRAMKLAGATGFDAYAHHPYYGYPVGDAEHEAAARQARPAPDGRHARQLRDADRRSCSGSTATCGSG